ncbi:PINN [Salix viminalis]|uniref:PINN n=1 Tax=Salix viminalis TaxID=40686 RepID=A0A9Q0TPG3_SALVM|nr:PINN [Salix viminalis]
MGTSSAAEKSEEELQREIDELHRQQRQISERLRDPRGLRRGGFSAAASAAPRNFASNGARNRGFVRPADRNDIEEQPPAKRRLLSAVVKVEEDGEIVEDPARAEDVKMQQLTEGGHVDPAIETQGDLKPTMLRQSGWPRRDVNERVVKRVNVESCLVKEGAFCWFDM